MDNLIGHKLGGRYEIQSEIGRGGMGIVFKAFDQGLRRVVAAKILLPQLAVDPEFVQRFEHEAVASANLHHTNIVTIHDVGVDQVEGWPGRAVYYIVMELIDGLTLDQWLHQRRSAMPVDEADRVVQQISSALQYAHSRDMIHRDIKPSNIMLDEDGQVKLMDFGLVRAGELSHLTRSGTVLGTPQYMAPEQITGGTVDPRTDIYSLGVVVYELLAGEVPFVRTTPMATAYAHVNDPPPPLTQRQPNAPKPVEAVVMKALAKDPQARYQSASQFGRDFGLAAAGIMPQGVQQYDQSALAATMAATRAAPPPPIKPGVPSSTSPSGDQPTRRTGLLIGAIALILLLVLGSAAIFLGDGLLPGVDTTATAKDDGAVTPADEVTNTPETDTPTAFSDTASGGEDLPKPAEATTAVAADAEVAVVPAVTPVPPPSPTARPVDTLAPTSTPVAARSAATNTPKPAPTSTPAPTRTPRQAVATATAIDAPTTPPTPRPVLTPCPAYLHKPLPGMGLLLVENHLGEPLHIDWPNGGQMWDLAPKQGDVPARLVVDLPPGRHDLNDNTARGYGRISLDVEAGKAYISPIWYNDRAEELVYPLEIPNGCR